MAADQVPRQAGEGEAAITRFVRAVTQPGGRDVDWERVGAVGAIISALIVLHGHQTRSWRYLHTAATVLVIGAAAAGRLNKLVVAPKARLKAHDHDPG
jgi:hypothetical protein